LYIALHDEEDLLFRASVSVWCSGLARIFKAGASIHMVDCNDNYELKKSQKLIEFLLLRSMI